MFVLRIIMQPASKTQPIAIDKTTKVKKAKLKRANTRQLPTSILKRSGLDEESTLVIQCHSPNAKLPLQGSLMCAGCDLYAAENVIINPHAHYAVSTGISVVSFPKNCYGRLAGRSGLALQHGIMVGAGVIDRDYNWHHQGGAVQFR